MNRQVTLRKARRADVTFLTGLREKTMREHLERAGIGVDEKALATRVLDHFECAEIIMIGGKAVGLLKVNREGAVWDLIQIQLLPHLQGKGVGRKLIERLLSEAAAAGASVKLSVLKGNPAKKLYEQLGFRVVREGAKEYFMRHSQRRVTTR